MIEERPKIDLTDYDDMGMVRGFNGFPYEVLVLRDLHPIRKWQILKEMILGKLELKGHYFDPVKRRDLL
jgi:hypothetical protein